MVYCEDAFKMMAQAECSIVPFIKINGLRIQDGQISSGQSCRCVLCKQNSVLGAKIPKIDNTLIEMY